MKKIAIALCLLLAGCVSAIPTDSPTTMIPFVRKADTPGGPVSKAEVVSLFEIWCQEYKPIQFWPPAGYRCHLNK